MSPRSQVTLLIRTFNLHVHVMDIRVLKALPLEVSRNEIEQLFHSIFIVYGLWSTQRDTPRQLSVHIQLDFVEQLLNICIRAVLLAYFGVLVYLHVKMWYSCTTFAKVGKSDTVFKYLFLVFPPNPLLPCNSTSPTFSIPL